MNRTRLDLVDARDFRRLFVEELGWERPNQPDLTVEADDQSYDLKQVAGFKGVRVWVCPTVPSARVQRLIDHAVKRISDERLIIFADRERQEWRWPQTSNTQGTGQPRLTTHTHFAGTDNPALDQRLAMVEIGLDEEPSVVELLRRMRSAFDADRVTKAFYDAFLAKHKALVQSIKGLDDLADREWYSALLMNRLMFVYFMQRKGFMDGDRDYLRTRLERLRELSGAGHFYEFFRDLLLPLFHEGLGAPGLEVADAKIRELLGTVPYLNGGIFNVHELEHQNLEIHIPDEVFQDIFGLFDAYQWHLDDRPSADQNEINPDVLGYIFEQFINQKEQGAYYTREDVTHFMTASTLLPVFLERLERATPVDPWAYVRHEPARYIWESLQYGADRELPPTINSERPGFPRPSWGDKAPQNVGHPGETWWEVDQRRRNLSSVVTAAESGLITDVDAAITRNLDLESLATDVIDGLARPEDVVAAWRILSDLRILDPTCGSGAFLFAALKILQGLYGAVLDAARRHAETSNLHDLSEILEVVDRHPSERYFVLKHISLNNLYGVDLMKEAAEIARLRLFLKLMSAVDDPGDVEPLPDLDFNIKPGNVLVGALRVSDIEATNDLILNQTIDEVVAQANEVGRLFDVFREIQQAGDHNEVKAARIALAGGVRSVRQTVNRYYHSMLGVSESLDDWVESHVPFHWFIEFPEVFSGGGGFDVVIGNPPYVAKSRISRYRFRGFRTDSTPDIYAPCTERSAQVTSPEGRMSLIIPISAQFGGDFAALRLFLEDRFDRIWVSAFSRNPAALFSAGLGVRSTIVIGSGNGLTEKSLHVTKTHRWVDDYRPALFETLTYVDCERVRMHAGWIRLVDNDIADLFARLAAQARLGQIAVRRGPFSVGFKSIVLYWLSVFMNDPPAYDLDYQPTPQTSVGRLSFRTEDDAKLALAVLASKLAFVWWYCTSDDFHATNEGLKSTPVNVSALSHAARKQLRGLADVLIRDLPNHVLFTKYKAKWMGTYVHAEMRDITDQIDTILASELGYEHLLPALEHSYYCVYKPTGDRPGTLRYDPALATDV